jgi:hypothetical protein
MTPSQTVFLNLENTVWDEKILALIFGAAVEPITFHPRNTVLDAQLMVYCESNRIEITSQKRQTHIQTKQSCGEARAFGLARVSSGA